MSAEFADEKIRRGQVLRQQGRAEDAEAFFKQAIADDPEHDYAYFELALCLMDMPGHRKEALDSIDRAIALEPEYSVYHATRAMVLTVLDRGKEALVCAETAIQLDPDSAFARTAKARAYLVLERWAKAEASAREALALDSDDTSAGNILAMALRLQGKLAENAGAVSQLLSDAPEDPLAHLNAGWSALQHGDPKGAEQHFRESLRLDPEFEAAREGLLESFKARSPIFRQYLKYCFFMQRFQQGARFAIIIGIYLAFRFGRAFLMTIHPAAAAALTFAYLLLVLWVWVAAGVGNLLILLDRSARLALKRSEAIEGITVGGGLIVGGPLILLGLGLGLWPLTVAGAGFVAGALPASLTFTNPSRAGQRFFGSIFAVTYLSTLITSLTLAVAPDTVHADALQALCGFALIACLLCTWLGNIGSLRRVREA
ncbi:MAG: tetratricopeptide repeat protein [Verrucomicrobia bacterium]|nr:tetratricopeptide repeat protein [Verrucomicrobiota bacterium]